MDEIKRMTRRILYLGLDPQHYRQQVKGEIVHWPIIQIVPRPLSDPLLQEALLRFPLYSHLIVTSKSTVNILATYLPLLGIPHWQDKQTVAVGKVTAAALIKEGIHPCRIAREETAEGVAAELEQLDLKEAHLFWPHSSQARRVLKDFLVDRSLCHTTCVLYDPVPRLMDPLPHLEDFDRVVFTSPSTVDAFFQLFKTWPDRLEFAAIGPITAHYLQTRNGQSR